MKNDGSICCIDTCVNACVSNFDDIQVHQKKCCSHAACNKILNSSLETPINDGNSNEVQYSNDESCGGICIPISSLLDTQSTVPLNLIMFDIEQISMIAAWIPDRQVHEELNIVFATHRLDMAIPVPDLMLTIISTVVIRC
jgi:hypothetical protein